MTSIKVVGATRVANRYRTLAANHDQIVEPVIEKYVKSLQKKLSRKKAPPKLPNQKYVRTGRTQSSFSAQRVGRGSWGITNSRKGAEYVIDERRQARIHQGRWFTMQGEEYKTRPELTREITREIVEYVSD